jgi:hypothetical protein
MRTLEAFALCYTCTDARRLRVAAKIHGTENPLVLEGTVQTEQPNAADEATA